MSDKHVLDALSAYIDGEAAHPDRIERHLRRCPECARRHMELLKLSSHLGAMNVPEVPPEFLTRVMAHAREAEMLPARRFWLPASPGWVAALALIVVGLALLYGARPNGSTPATTSREQVAVVRDTTLYLDDEAVVDAMAKLMDEGVDLTYVAPDASGDWLPEDNFITYDEMVVSLAEEIEDEGGDPYLGGDTNVYGLIDGMGSSEAAVLGSLLTDYMGEG